MTDGSLPETGSREGLLRAEIKKQAGEVRALKGINRIGQNAAGLPDAKKQQILDKILTSGGI